LGKDLGRFHRKSDKINATGSAKTKWGEMEKGPGGEEVYQRGGSKETREEKKKWSKGIKRGRELTDNYRGKGGLGKKVLQKWGGGKT